MIEPAKTYFFVFGALTILGGLMGFIRKKSRASLIAGGISGALLIVAGGLMLDGRAQAGLIMGLVVSLALAGQFVPKFLRTRNWMPAGMMAVLSVIGLVLGALALAKG